MSKWREVRLGEVVDIISGGTPKTAIAEYWDGDIPWISIKDFVGIQRKIYSTEKSITKLGLENSATNILQKGDIIISARGTVGEVAQLGTSMAFNQSCYGLKGRETTNDYLFYLLKYSKPLLIATATGATFGTIIRKTFDYIKIQIPDIKTQEKIADVLSTYDELIQNNNRRIEILEKMAEEIYKEWFVRMRFPGHENVKSEKGVPEGWKVKKVGEIIDKLESGKRPKNICEEEKMIVSLGAGDVKNLGEYSDSDEYLIPYSFFRGLNRGVVESKDIAVYKDGAYTGKVTMFRDDFPYKEMAINEHVFLVRCKDEKLQNYLLFTLKQKSYYELIQALSMTSAQPGINQSKFKNIKIEIPNKELINKFHNISELYLRKIFNLAKQNQNLIKQRDLLLPRLMNGTIEVK